MIGFMENDIKSNSIPGSKEVSTIIIREAVKNVLADFVR